MPVTPLAKVDLRNDPLFYLWLDPGESDRALTLKLHPHVRLYGRADAANVNSYKPPGADNYASTNAANIAKRLADWQKYNACFVGDGSFNSGNYDGSVFVQNLFTGSAVNFGGTIFRHVADQRDGKQTCWTDSGVASVNGSANTVSAIVSALKTELDSQGLAYPHTYLGDLEEQFSPPEVHDAGDGWWLQPTAVSTDPRWDGNIVAIKTSDDTEKTLEQMWQDADFGNSLTPNASAVWYDTSNRAFSIFCSQLYIKVADHVMEANLYQPFKAVFPSIMCGDYQKSSALDPAHPIYTEINPWLTLPTPSGYDLLADFSSPVFYGAATTLVYPDRWRPGVGNPFSTTDNSTLYRNFAKSQVDACVAAGNTKAVIPWAMRPRMMTDTSIGMRNPPYANANDRYVVTLEDLKHVLRYAYDNGVNEFILFEGDWLDHSGAGDTDDVLRETLDLVNDIVTYAGGSEWPSLSGSGTAPEADDSYYYGSY